MLKTIFCQTISAHADASDVEARMDLYMKAGPNGSVGDCPFAHYIRMILHVKGLSCNLHPCTQEQKPEWLLAEFEGKMPCLDDAGDRRIESSVIAEYLEAKYPEPPLQQGFDEAVMVDAQNATSKLFPNLAKFLKNNEFDYYAEKGLLTSLKDFEAFLKQRPEGDYLLGHKISLLDCSLAPKLYVLDVATKHFYPDTHKKFQEFEHIQKYMKHMFATEAFKSTMYPTETMIWGWKAAKEQASKACGV